MNLQLKKMLAAGMAGLSLLTLSALPVSADRTSQNGGSSASSTENTLTDGVVTYTYVDGGVEVQSCDTAIIAVNILDEIDGYKIVSIADGAFYGCDNMKSLTLGNNITRIGEGAFMGCVSLTQMTIPDSVKEIGSHTFYGCASLSEVTLPDHLTTIPEGMFQECNVLQSVELPDSLTTIGSAAFFNCSLLSDVTFHEGLETLGDYAFAGCLSFTDVQLPDSLHTIGAASFYDCVGLTSFHIPDTVETVGTLAFMNCRSLKEFTVDEGHASFTVKDGVLFDVPQETLYVYPAGREETSYIVPSSVTMIYDGAFFGSELTEIVFPEKLETVGAGAFEYCEQLKAIALPEGTKQLYDNAFADCTALREVSLPQSLESIGAYAFYACPKLREVTVPDGCTSIGDYAFGFTDGTEEKEDGTIEPVRIDDFRLLANSGTPAKRWASANRIAFKSLNFSVMGIVWIVLGVAVLAVIVFLLVRVIKKNQLTAEERKALAEAEDDEDEEEYESIVSEEDKPDFETSDENLTIFDKDE